MVGDNKRAALIANAADNGDATGRREYVQQETEALRQLGFIPEELDLRDYFNGTINLHNTLSKYGLLWILGGNTFILRRAMVQSGFDIAARKFIETDQLVYAGFSAGSCAVTPDLHGLELVDDPDVVPTGYNSEIIWEGMGLVDFAIAPHFQSNHPESLAVDKVVDYFQEHGINFLKLRDGEVILVNSYQHQIVS